MRRAKLKNSDGNFPTHPGKEFQHSGNEYRVDMRHYPLIPEGDADGGDDDGGAKMNSWIIILIGSILEWVFPKLIESSMETGMKMTDLSRHLTDRHPTRDPLGH
ncbi:hypothetical protein F511_42733 [Dorcoceras hygrometricum]|uniref:Uncharacterized protein n=1 Tax=Dorcoceras hygrometricum TaxID=472368 RepID=A0A2Z7A6D0_9LAMI|nr:hypothetical protein F511_42733 [Dorcoceras hygrometricum]